MFKIFVLLISALLLMPFSKLVYGQATDAKSVNEYSERTKFYEDQASSLTSVAIFDALESQSRLQVLKPIDLAKVFSLDEDSYRSIGYATALEKRKNNKDPYGAFFYGAYKWNSCTKVENASSSHADDVKRCWLEVFDSFKIASDAKLPDASMNIAKMFERGAGVMTSKFAAADWYVKAADQYNTQKSRDEALAAVEAALIAVPDHPAALRRKKAMLK